MTSLSFLLSEIEQRESPHAAAPAHNDLIGSQQERGRNCDASALAVLTLITTSHRVGCSTGRATYRQLFRTRRRSRPLSSATRLAEPSYERDTPARTSSSVAVQR